MIIDPYCRIALHSKMDLIHATSISISSKGVLIRGASGMGKSDLAFRLMNLGATLISDDYTNVAVAKDKVILSPPNNIEGKIELRGIGIVTVPFKTKCALKLIIDLVKPNYIPRLPDQNLIEFEGHKIPSYQFSSFETSTPEKIHFLLKSIE